MHFKITSGWEIYNGRNAILLKKDNWDDYGYKTLFHAIYCDAQGEKYELGSVKIAKANMNNLFRTSDYLSSEFDSLPDGYYSLWQTAEAYKRILECEKKCHFQILNSLQDIAADPDIYNRYEDEEVLKKSLFRAVSQTLYMRQFRRIVRGEAVLTPYLFSYVVKNSNSLVDDCVLEFSVVPESLPPTNVHAIIGNNGTGKTTLIKQMVRSICRNENKGGVFRYDEADSESEIFENVICISFSPFDDYSEIENCSSNFKYIGIRKEYDSDGYEDGYGEINLLDDIRKNYMSSLESCHIDMIKKDDLQKTLEMLETECNFISSNYEYDMNIDELMSDDRNSIEKKFDKLSAGHKVVLSIITRCIDELVEKSVVFIDEPENHLHPPLLSSLVRGISNMLIKRNGVAIISTHSPIVLQEIPRSNVWILNRVGSAMSARRPEIETFGTNIGVLTNEIFGYEVQRTGFNTLLMKSVERCDDYESVLKEYSNQLGNEARNIIRILLKQKGMR